MCNAVTMYVRSPRKNILTNFCKGYINFSKGDAAIIFRDEACWNFTVTAVKRENRNYN